MTNRGAKLIKWAIIAAALLTLAYIMDEALFGGINTGLSYALWSLQYQWRLAFWIPAVMLIAGLGPAAYLFLKARQAGDDYRRHAEERRYYRAGWAAASIGAVLSVVSFALLGHLIDGDRKQAILRASDIKEISSAVPISEASRMPREVASKIASLYYSRSDFNPTNLTLTRSCKGRWVWTMIQTPRRKIGGQTGGVIEIDAEQNQVKEIRTANQLFKYGPNMGVRDGILYQARSKLNRSLSLPSSFGIIGCDGKPYIIAPLMSWRKAGVSRYKSQTGVLVINGQGAIKAYDMDAAKSNPLLRQSGRIVSPEQALWVAESYRYKLGRQNQSRGLMGFIAPGQQKDRLDPLETSPKAAQPYLAEGPSGRPLWVTLMQPYRSGKGAAALLYIDAESGRGMIYRTANRMIISPDEARKAGYEQRAQIGLRAAKAGEAHLLLDGQGRASYLVSLTNPRKSAVTGTVLVDGTDGEANKRDGVTENSKVDPQAGQRQGTSGKVTELSLKELEILLAACRKDTACRDKLLR